ncbi:hypothetical protein RirG_072530 [Rhizophagus irregularis DAOM 197198w]|uniref:Uncharacterized protein n=1 Tax=Rhizophagus irregularis (strain DAOM 197198w) TaxID=1432141 RepID=A0A015JRC8_RHIIW|nr:hypothetical protein RirG_072530 [Rhizophagus irregularis DAOM 197198w]
MNFFLFCSPYSDLQFKKRFIEIGPLDAEIFTKKRFFEPLKNGSIRQKCDLVIISPLLWVIYLDPLLMALKNEKKDPYRLVSPSAPATLSSTSCSPDVLEVNNLVFMDDSTLISSSKKEMEHMLMITEEFYHLNNTSTNHNKYFLATC